METIFSVIKHSIQEMLKIYIKLACYLYLQLELYLSSRFYTHFI